MANPLPKKRQAHAPDCTLDKPKEWFKGRKDEKGVPVDSHRHLYCSCGNNPLDNEDFRRINIPLGTWDFELKGVTEGVRGKVANYLSRIHKARSEGISLYVCGSHGVGKTGVGIVILKEARAWGYTAFATTVNDLRDAVKEKARFDSESTTWEWVRGVDFLLLDDLQEMDLAERFVLTINDVRGLLLSRHEKGLVTIVTSPLLPGEWGKKNASGISNAIEKAFVTLVVPGDNRHGVQQKLKSKILD